MHIYTPSSGCWNGIIHFTHAHHQGRLLTRLSLHACMHICMLISWDLLASYLSSDMIHARRSLCCGFGPLRKQALTADREITGPLLPACMQTRCSPGVHTRPHAEREREREGRIHQCVHSLHLNPNHRIKQRVDSGLMMDRPATDCTAGARCPV